MNLLLKVGDAAVFGLEPVFLVVFMLVLGLILLAAEIFIIPGFGVAGVLGLLFLIGGSVASWLLLGQEWGALTIFGTIAISITFGIIFFKSRIVRKRLVLDTHLIHGGGVQSQDLSRFIGSIGVTRSDLRPAGIAVVDDNRLDVVSEGGFVEKGMKVKVVAVDGPRVVVAKLTEEEKEK